MKLCPQCSSSIIWKGCNPRPPLLNCVKCSYAWNDAILETSGEYGCFMGDWDDVEIYKLELQLRADQPSKDWNFFKGRKIWTAWRNTWGPGDVISVKMLDDLIHWVSQATTNTHWKRSYKNESI